MSQDYSLQIPKTGNKIAYFSFLYLMTQVKRFE